MIHLRNLYKGKYGHIGWWWWKDGPFAVGIDQAKWFLDINTEKLAVESLRTGKRISFKVQGHIIKIGPCKSAWNILELKQID